MITEVKVGNFVNKLRMSQEKGDITFVDKTDFLPDLFNMNQYPQLFVRPKRFGKTFTMDMIKSFFQPGLEIKKEGDIYNFHPTFGKNPYTKYFQATTAQGMPLKITKKNFFKTHHAQIPVLFVSFLNVLGNNIAQYKSTLRRSIQEFYIDYNYLFVAYMLNIAAKTKLEQKRISEIMESQKDSPLEKQIQVLCICFMKQQLFKRSIDKSPLLVQYCRYYFFNETIELKDCSCLKHLALLMFKVYNKQILCLVDQYDNGIMNLVTGYMNKDGQITIQLIKQASKTLTGLLKSVAKMPEPVIHHFILTGVTEVLVDISNSGFNNIKINSLGRNYYQGLFGLSEEQMKCILDSFAEKKGLTPSQKQKMMNQMKKYYSGYGLDNKCLYNPWSIVNYIMDRQNYQDQNTISNSCHYWQKSGGNTLFRSLILSESLYFKISSIRYEKPLQSQNPLCYKYRQYSSTDFMGDFISKKSIDENMLFFLLIRFGYLAQIIQNKKLMGFRIPNKEIEARFQQDFNVCWLKGIGIDFSDANNILQQFKRNFYDPQLLSQTIKNHCLKYIKGHKSEIGFSATIYSFFMVGIATKKFQTYAYIQYPIEGKLIDTLIVPSQSSAQKQILINQYKVNYTKQDTQNADYLEEAEKQCYINNYLQACSVIPQTRPWTHVIIRSIVFWQNRTDETWNVVIKDRKIPADRYKNIISLFALSKLKKAMVQAGIDIPSNKNLRTIFLQNRNKAWPSLLNLHKKANIDDLINSEITSNKQAEELNQSEIGGWKFGANEIDKQMQGEQITRQQPHREQQRMISVQRHSRQEEKKKKSVCNQVQTRKNSLQQRNNISKQQKPEKRKKKSPSASRQSPPPPLEMNQPVALRLRKKKYQNISTFNVSYDEASNEKEEATTMPPPKIQQARVTEGGVQTRRTRAPQTVNQARQRQHRNIRKTEKEIVMANKRQQLERVRNSEKQ